VLVPPWVTIEFGPSPAFSQPNPGCPFGFHHTLRSPELCTRPRCLSSHSDLRRPASLLIHPDPTPSSHSAQLLCSALFFLLTRLTAYAILRRQIQITAGQTWSDARLEHQIRHPSTTTSTRAIHAHNNTFLPWLLFHLRIHSLTLLPPRLLLHQTRNFDA
jgi:hypothetical protein